MNHENSHLIWIRAEVDAELDEKALSTCRDELPSYLADIGLEFADIMQTPPSVMPGFGVGSGPHVRIMARVPFERSENNEELRARVRDTLAMVGLEFADLGCDEITPDPFTKGGLPDGAY